jgi:hypothetical protein
MSLSLHRLPFQIAVACALVLRPAPAVSEGRPQPPDHPASTEDCFAFQRQQVDYGNSALRKSKECSQNNRNAKNQDFVSFTPSCGGVKITGYRPCQQEFDASWCAYSDFSKQFRDCMAKVGQATREQKQFDEDMKKTQASQDKIRQELRLEQCNSDSVFPKVPDAGCQPPKSSGSGFEGM